MKELGEIFMIFMALYGLISLQQDFEAWCDRRRKRLERCPQDTKHD